MTSMMPNLCGSCARLDARGTACTAFPKGIPDDILLFGGDHRAPDSRQVGRDTFKLVDAKYVDYEYWLMTHDLSGPLA